MFNNEQARMAAQILMVLEHLSCHSSYQQLSRTFTPGPLLVLGKQRQKDLVWSLMSCFSLGHLRSLVIAGKLLVVACLI